MEKAKEKRDKKEKERTLIQETFQESKSNLESERNLLKEAAIEIQGSGEISEVQVKEKLDQCRTRAEGPKNKVSEEGKAIPGA